MSRRHFRRKEKKSGESDRAKRAHGGVKNEKFAEIVLIYAGSERSELASDSAKLMQFIAAVFDAFLRSRPWFCPRKPRACQPVAGVAGCSVASGDLCCRFQAPLCSMLSPLCLVGPLPLRISLHQLPLLAPTCEELSRPRAKAESWRKSKAAGDGVGLTKVTEER